MDIRYTTFSDGFPLDVGCNGLPDKVDEHVANILHSDSSSTPSNYLLIVDTLCIWSKKIATKYGLVKIRHIET